MSCIQNLYKERVAHDNDWSANDCTRLMIAIAESASINPAVIIATFLSSSLYSHPFIALMITFTPENIIIGIANAIVILKRVFVILTKRESFLMICGLLVSEISILVDQRNISFPTAFLVLPILMTWSRFLDGWKAVSRRSARLVVEKKHIQTTIPIQITDTMIFFMNTKRDGEEYMMLSYIFDKSSSACACSVLVLTASAVLMSSIFLI